MSEPLPTEPVHPREYVQDVDVTVEPNWKLMDLPFYGAVSKDPCTELSLTLSYLQFLQGVTPENLRLWWPQALAQAGWVETSRSAVRADGGLGVDYRLPDGRDALLTIEPREGLWWVSVVVSPNPK